MASLKELIEMTRTLENLMALDKRCGEIVGFVGPMFSGKTTELLRMYERYIIGRKKSVMVKPSLDNRYGESHVVTHMGYQVDAYALEDSQKLLELVEQLKLEPITVGVNSHSVKLEGLLKGVFIDEIQFFDSGIIYVVEKLANDGIDIYWSGLNQDSRGKPFSFRDGKEHIGYLMAISDDLHVLNAVCIVCSDKATKTYRKIESPNLIEIGGGDKYEARCRRHWEPR